MAINHKNRYPAKFGAVSADWPTGEPKNIAAAGDGTGSPWIADVVKDFMGEQQGAMIDVGMTPDDVEETALASQYLEARGKLHGRVVQATTSILTSDQRRTHVVKSLGYAAAGDGGAAVWISTGNDVPGAAGTSDFAAGLIYDSVGREFSIAPGRLNVKAYGAVGDGSADDTTPVNHAILTQNARGGGEVYLPAGTYRGTDEVTQKDKVWLNGDGPEVSKITFAGANPANFTNGYCIYGTGTWMTLPALSADLDQGDTTLTFGADHNLEPDDLIAIVDPRDFSLSAARSYYRAGEFTTVATITSNIEVSISAPLIATGNPAVTGGDGYTAAQVSVIKVFPIRCAVKNLSVEGIGTTTTVGIVGVAYGRECSMSNLRGTGSQLSMFAIDRCYDCTFKDIYGFDYGAAAGLNYCVAINNSQLVFHNRLRGGVTRHFWANGGDPGVNAIPNRFQYINDMHTKEATEALYSTGLHGNSEHIYFANCTLWGHIISGDRTRISDSVIYAMPAPNAAAVNRGAALAISDTHGWDHEIADCEIIATVDVGSNRGLVFLSESTPDLHRGGTMRFNNVKIDMRGKTGFVGLNHVYSTTIKPELEFNNVQIRGSGDSTNFFYCLLAGGGPSSWGRIAFNNVEVDGADVFVNASELTVFNGFYSRNAPGYGVRVGDQPLSAVSEHRVEFYGGNIRGAQLAGVFVDERDATIVSFNLTSLANNQSAGGLSNSSFTVFPTVDTGTVKVLLVGSTFGDDQDTTTQSRSHYIADVDELFDVDTTRLGGKTRFLSSVTTVKTKADWDDVTDYMTSTGALSILGGDIAGAPTGAKSLVSGDASADQGMYFKSPSTGNSRIIFGDEVVANRFQILLQHASNRALLAVNGTTMARLLSTGIHPWTDGVDVLGSTSLRWGSLYANDCHTKRIQASGATAITSGDVSSLTGWGTGAIVSSAAGTDQGGRITINSGTGASANPTFVLTFTDGAWSGGTPAVVVGNSGTQAATWTRQAGNSTTVTIRFDGTPADSTAYTVEFIAMGV